MFKILSLMLVVSTFIQAAENNATITYVEKSVKKQVKGNEQWDNTSTGAKVISGDKVRTFSKSRAEISLENLSVIRLAPKTTLNVEKLFEESAGEKLKTSLDVEEGEIWSNTEKLNDDLEFDVNTDVAGMAIKGTIFRVIKKENGNTKLKVYRGRVEIAANGGNDQPEKKEISAPKQISGPKEVDLKTWLEVVENMQEIEVSKDGLMLFKKNFDFTSEEEAGDWAAWNKERDKAVQKERLEKKAKELKEKINEE